MPLIFVNLDHRRRIILLNHPTQRLPTQASFVFFHYCSFLNDFPFLALVVKPVIYLSQRRRKTKKSFHAFRILLRLSFFAFWKRLLEMTRGRIYFDNEKRRDMQYWSWTFFIFHGVLLCLDTFRCNYIENSWNILNIRKQMPNLTTTSTSIWCSLLFHRRFLYVPCKKWIAEIPMMNRNTFFVHTSEDWIEFRLKSFIKHKSKDAL